MFQYITPIKPSYLYGYVKENFSILKSKAYFLVFEGIKFHMIRREHFFENDFSLKFGRSGHSAQWGYNNSMSPSKSKISEISRFLTSNYTQSVIFRQWRPENLRKQWCGRRNRQENTVCANICLKHYLQLLGQKHAGVSLEEFAPCDTCSNIFSIVNDEQNYSSHFPNTAALCSLV